MPAAEKPDLVYQYCDVGGAVLFEVLRFPGKKFCFRHPGPNGGWIWNLDGVERVPYRLNEVALADDVFLVEGEKDVETLRELGIVASTNPGGAGGWRSEFAYYFVGKNVVLIPDADSAGERWADKVSADLRGVARALKKINLPGLDAGSGADVTDWLAQGHTKADLLAQVESAQDLLFEDGATLLRKVETFITRFVILEEGAVLLMALWSIGTHCFSVFDCYPFLTFISPVKRCGKTRAAAVLSLLVSKPEVMVSPTEATVFRLIEERHPSVILDEAELLFSEKSKSERAAALRAVLDAGHRNGARVPRCVGPTHQVQYFDVYSPKLLCANGWLPETILDRSVIIFMQRRLPEQIVERYILRRIQPIATGLRVRIERWVDKNFELVKRAHEEIALGFVTDREEENFSPLAALLVILNPARAPEYRAAVEKLVARKAGNDVEDSFKLRLLADITSIIEQAEFQPEEIIPTADLLGKLSIIPDSQWAGEFHLSAHRLARTLREFNCRPVKVRRGSQTIRGWRVRELAMAASPYIACQTATSATSLNRKSLENKDVAPVAHSPHYGGRDGENPRT